VGSQNYTKIWSKDDNSLFDKLDVNWIKFSGCKGMITLIWYTMVKNARFQPRVGV